MKQEKYRTEKCPRNVASFTHSCTKVLRWPGPKITCKCATAGLRNRKTKFEHKQLEIGTYTWSAGFCSHCYACDDNNTASVLPVQHFRTCTFYNFLTHIYTPTVPVLAKNDFYKKKQMSKDNWTRDKTPKHGHNMRLDAVELPHWPVLTLTILQNKNQKIVHSKILLPSYKLWERWTHLFQTKYRPQEPTLTSDEPSHPEINS